MKALLPTAALISCLLFQHAAFAQASTTTTTATKTVVAKWTPLNVPAMGKDLELDRTMIATVSRINEDYNKQYAALGKATTAQVSALTERRDAERRKVLTKEQYKIWLKVRDAEAAAIPPEPKVTRKEATKQ